MYGNDEERQAMHAPGGRSGRALLAAQALIAMAEEPWNYAELFNTLMLFLSRRSANAGIPQHAILMACLFHNQPMAFTQSPARIQPVRQLSILLFSLFALVAPLSAASPLPRSNPMPPPDSVQSTSPQPGDTLLSDVKALWNDGVAIFTAPARFSSRDWIITGGVVAGTTVLMFADDPVRKSFSLGHDSTKDDFASVGDYYGTGAPGGILAIGLYTGGIIFDAPGVRLAGRHIIQSLIYAGAITTTLKILAGRHRPYLNDGPHAFDGPSLTDMHHSFPSGHSTVAFAIGSSLSADIDHPVATVLLYSLATLTAASRIYDDRHWLSDTFLGAAIGTACGYATAHMHDPASGKGSSFNITPTPDGINVSWVF